MAQAAHPQSDDGLIAHVVYVLRSNPVTALAALMFATIVAAAVFGPSLVPYDPLASNAARALEAPSWDHWFGTDNLGRDIFSRVVVAARLDLSIAVAAVALSCVVGAVLGAVAGYWGGWPDRVISRLMDTVMAFPLFVLGMGIVAALGNTIEPSSTCRFTPGSSGRR